MKYIFYILLVLMSLSSQASVVTAFKQLGPGINVNGGLTSDPSTARAGDLYYNTSLGTYRFYNGSAWGGMGGSSGVSIGDGITGGTYGDILYIVSTGDLDQDDDFEWDDVTPGLYVNGYFALGSGQIMSIGSDEVLFHDPGNANDFIGAHKGGSLTGNSDLVVGGGNSGAAITSGNQNTLVGSGTGSSLTSGLSNSFFGNGVGNAVTTTNNNSFFGQASGANATGQGNAGLGAISVQNGSGDFNTGVGMQACDNMTTGSRNTCIGINAGAQITSGNDNTIIGRSADVAVGTFSNSFSIGANTLIGASNVGILGDSSVNVGVGNVNSSIPTARLHLPAGTTSASSAPLKITPGTLMTTPESGAIENTGPSLFFTTSTPTRKTIAMIGDDADKQLSNLTGTTAVPVDLLPSGSQAQNLGSQTHQWSAVWFLQSVADLRYIGPLFESFPDTNSNTNFQSGPNSTGDSGAAFFGSGNTTGASHNSGPVTVDSGTSAAGTRGSVTVKGATLVLNPDATSINMSSHKLSSVTDPTSAQDAATKNYVDTAQSHSARAHNSATTINGTPATVVWTTEDWDDDNALASGVFTVATTVNTKYQINASVLVTGTVALNDTVVIGLYRNGSLISQNTFYAAAGLTDVKATLSDIGFYALSDTVEIKLSTSITGPSIVSSNTENFFSIAKLP